jgi:hypothetical protein
MAKGLHGKCCKVYHSSINHDVDSMLIQRLELKDLVTQTRTSFTKPTLLQGLVLVRTNNLVVLILGVFAMKSAKMHLLALPCLSVCPCPSAYNNSRTSDSFFIKFDIGKFY